MGFFSPESRSGAIFSDCGKYRYLLWRIWDHGPIIPWLMYNPSHGNGSTNDPTIWRCIEFSRRLGGGGLWIVNFHALISAHPDDISLTNNPIGPDNDLHLNALLTTTRANNLPIICGWGANPILFAVDRHFIKNAKKAKVRLCCLGKNKNGSPRHPLFLKPGIQLEEYA